MTRTSNQKEIRDALKESLGYAFDALNHSLKDEAALVSYLPSHLEAVDRLINLLIGVSEVGSAKLS